MEGGRDSSTMTLTKQAQQLAPKLQACKQDSSHFQDETHHGTPVKNNVGLYNIIQYVIVYCTVCMKFPNFPPNIQRDLPAGFDRTESGTIEIKGLGLSSPSAVSFKILNP